MCGLFGYISNNAELSEEKKRLRTLIFRGIGLSMMARGTDAAGIANKSGDIIKTYKQGRATFEQLCSYDGFNERINQSHIVIGHTRQATHGANTNANAHPFIKGGIVGAHNGVVSNWADINPNAQVDSEVIFEALDKEENCVEKVFPQLQGSIAATWMNINDPDKIFFVKHTNPIALVASEELGTIFWASTATMLSFLVQAAFGAKQVFYPAEDIVYSIDRNLNMVQTPVKFKSYFNHAPNKLPNVFENSENSRNVEKGQIRNKSRIIKSGDDPNYADLIRYLSYESGCEFCGQLPDLSKDYGFYFEKTVETIACVNCAMTQKIDTRLPSIEWINRDKFEILDRKCAPYTLEQLWDMAQYYEQIPISSTDSDAKKFVEKPANSDSCEVNSPKE